MLQIVVLLNTNYSSESDIEDISGDCIIEFVNEMNFDNFTDLYLEIENTQVKNIKWEDRRETKLYKLITFICSSFIESLDNKFEIKTVVAKNFFKNIRSLIYGSYVIHHSDITGEIIGYAHDFCNKKIRENNSLIPVYFSKFI